jgi:FkbM family methyltransferase
MSGLSNIEKLLLFYGASLPDHPRKWWLHDQLLRLFRITVDQELDVVRNGLKWRLNPADYTDASLFWMNCRDDWDILHLKRFLRPGLTVFDVGANFGYYSVVLATTLNRQCRMFACEPNPMNFERLEKHVLANDMAECVQLINLGLSDRDETVCMHRPRENSGHAMVCESGETVSVHLTTLDSLCEKKQIDQLDLLILDTEGYEQRALQGASEMLLRFTPLIFVELFPPVMRRQGADPEAVAAFLTGQGYQLFVSRKNRLIPLTAVPTGEKSENVFAFHEKHFDAGIVP